LILPKSSTILQAVLVFSIEQLENRTAFKGEQTPAPLNNTDRRNGHRLKRER